MKSLCVWHYRKSSILLCYFECDTKSLIESNSELENVVVVEDCISILEKRKSKNSAFIMSREMQSSRIAVSQSITENVIYSNVRANRRSFMFNTLLITNDSQQKDSIFIDILKDLIF
jgi:hypothetical protein